MGNLKVQFLFFFWVKKLIIEEFFGRLLPQKNFDTKFVNFYKIRQFNQNYRETQDIGQSTFDCNGNN